MSIFDVRHQPRAQRLVQPPKERLSPPVGKHQQGRADDNPLKYTRRQGVQHAPDIVDAVRENGRQTVEGEKADLTTLEFDLLAALAAQPRRVFSRRQLIEAIWGWDYFGDERVVDVHIRKLRKALDDDAAEPRVVGTVRGVGYKFIPEA